MRFLRSRPCHKNDNAHVEQKNWSHARQLLGYERLEIAALLGPINALYAQVWSPLQNYFCPSLQLKEKSQQGSRIIRRYHPAQTACARLLAWPQCPRARRRELREMQAALDPLALVEEKERRLRKIFALARRSSRPHSASLRAAAPGSLHAAPAPAPSTPINPPFIMPSQHPSKPQPPVSFSREATRRMRGDFLRNASGVR